MKEYTLITGGTEGLGLELAKLFGETGHNLIIIARNIERLINVKKFLEDEYNVDVQILSIDLTIHNSCKEIFDFVDNNNIVVNYLVNNAAIGSFGFLSESSEEYNQQLIDINISSLTNLTTHFLKSMVKLKSGGIMNIASTAAFVGGPKMSMYYASKAYVLSLTEALHDEVKDCGVKVSCVCPGPLDTKFQAKSGIQKSDKAKKYLMSCDKVAKEAYKNFFIGKTIIVPGKKNKLLVLFSKFVPRKLSRFIILRTNS